VTDVTDGLIFTPLTISFSRFQNQAISKLPDFETGATEQALSNLFPIVVFFAVQTCFTQQTEVDINCTHIH
jgi:hypothetical protein